MFHGWKFQAGDDANNVWLEQHFGFKGSLYIGADPIYTKEMQKPTPGFSFTAYVAKLVTRVTFILNQIHVKSENADYKHVLSGDKDSACLQTLAI